jgi:predicted peroxiredoxin
MTNILYFGTSGSDDPTRASFPFVFAQGAIEAGHTPTIALAGEAVYLLKAEVAAATQGVGWPSMADQWKAVMEHQVPVYV